MQLQRVKKIQREKKFFRLQQDREKKKNDLKKEKQNICQLWKQNLKMDRYHLTHYGGGSLKPGTPGSIPSKTLIMNWLRSVLPDLPPTLKIEQFGNGAIYCRIINHYHPGTIPTSKIILNPKNQYEYSNNLKQVQQALVQLNIKINFDVNKVSKRKFLENWALINAIYKQLTSDDNGPEDSFSGGNKPSKRNLETYPENGFGSASKIQPLAQSSSTTNYNFMLPMWQKNSFNLPFPQNVAQNVPQNALKMTNYFKENQNNSPVKGKWSVNSHMFQNNQSAVVDRVKQILLKNSHDTEKIRQIKILLNIPIQEEEVIKIEEDQQAAYPNFIHRSLKKGMEEVKEQREDDDRKSKPSKNQSETQFDNSNRSVGKIPTSAAKSKKPFRI